MQVENPQQLFELTGSEVSAIGVVAWMKGEPGPAGQGATAIGLVLRDGSRRMLILAPGCEIVDPEEESVVEHQADRSSKES